jgi:N-methylhydantoinase B
MSAGFDPVLLEVWRHRLESVCEEMGAALQRSSFSPNIKERRDFSCALFDGRGRMAAQGDHLPVHLGSMPLSVAEALREGRRLGPGDVLALNDPYRGGTHLPDLTLVAPVFLEGEEGPAFFVADRAHHADMGGAAPGSMPLVREIYAEGLRVPPVRLVRGGRMEEDVVALLLANVRTPEERLGDLRAQLAALDLGARRLRELSQGSGAQQVREYAAHLRGYSERMTRETIRAIPPGEYDFEDFLDDDGFGNEEIRIAVRVAVLGDRASVDFTGSSPQVEGPVNANYAVTLSATVYVFRCLSAADIPCNQGCFEPLAVTAPEGCVVNARAPAAVGAGNVETSQRIVDVLLGALAQALPDRIPAASQGTMNNVLLGGHDPRTGRPFAYYETLGGGMGGRPGLAGASAIHTHMTNTRNTPIEALEHAYPLRVEAYRVRRGSGGAGRFAGGDGLVRELRMGAEGTLTLLTERRRRGPWGARGGANGTPGRNWLQREGRVEELPAKAVLRVRPGDVLRVETPGGGGWGSPPRPEGEG